MLVLLACMPPFDATPPVRGELAVEQGWSAVVPSVAVLSWSAPAGSTSRGEFTGPDGVAHATPTTAETEVTLPLLGLAAGATYDWRAISADPGGAERDATGTLTVPDAPDTLPWLRIDASTAQAQVPTGYVVGATTVGIGGPDADSYLAIWDADGAPVWWRALDKGHISVSTTLGAEPGTLWFDDYDTTTIALTATGHRVRVDGSDERVIGLPTGSHTIVEPEPGVVAWPGRDVRENPYLADTWVTADRVYEAPVDETEEAPREVVNFYDDLFHGTYSAPCDHTTTALRYDGLYPVYEWSHLNSLVYLADRDAYLANLRWVDTTLLIDRGSGQILWRLGGPLSDFTWANGDPLYTDAEHTVLSHAHLSQAWDGGLVAFDNRTHAAPNVSAIVELAWDEDARTVDEVFRWEDPQGRNVGILGDVRKLPGGDYLATWATLGELNEVTPDGTEVWHATTDPLRSVSRVVWVEDLYRLGAP